MIVTVENFQSIAKTRLDVEGLTVLVGPSDRGKSSLVRAIEAALFNLPGEYFVRSGTPSAKVTLEWTTGLDQHQHMGGHRIIWEKGSGKNEFRIDGETYSKVGTKAPDVLRQLGFRAELIGARIVEEEATGALKPEGGKWVRPQIAGQFDGIFLLQESGTFISEVVVKLSRLGVLQRASRQCALDGRQTRSKLKTRREDLDEATRRAEALAAAPHLRSRLDALVQLDDEIEVKRRSFLALQTLLQRRAGARERLRTALPVVDPNRCFRLDAAVTQYRQLLLARRQIARRQQLLQIPKKFPKTHCAVDGPEVMALQTVVQRYRAMQSLVGMRQMRVIALDAAAARLVSATDALTAAQQALDEFKVETPVCPVCTRPWAEQPALAGV